MPCRIARRNIGKGHQAGCDNCRSSFICNEQISLLAQAHLLLVPTIFPAPKVNIAS